MNTRTLSTRVIPSALGVLALAGSTVAAADADQSPPDQAKMAKHKVIADELDNPRQLSLTPGGKLLVAQAGHGSYDPANCIGEGEEAQCVGATGKITVIDSGDRWNPIAHLLSAAGPDGTFAVGSDGASKRRGGPYYAIITYAPPDLMPEGVPGEQAGKLIAKKPGGKAHVVADISKYEENHDPDGEGVESNPYSVLAQKKRVLVADAAGDTVYQVRKGKVRVFHKMKEYGKKVDAVPTSLATDARTGNILVGELHSEMPGKAKVWSLKQNGKVARTWKGFTTVTGVARAKNGTLYVSELFGGTCGFEDIPTCFPGRVVRVLPNGKRKAYAVPFPAGVVVKHGKPYVAAFSIAPSTGAMGNPNWNGQIWRLNQR
ncbi:ScyD/ScyE family protein [Solicola gregarius]|uniref:ScyD/ScyE family protein n=1 Tax=Solicola gregarius TaxID=2908642 RepID=A0AA46YP14_9ACTN|nr:ScyD/ScyE family protein [Solicola gregarius]UYM07183.1 ScyD/ScyE family protein [Solicola gregarius]